MDFITDIWLTYKAEIIPLLVTLLTVFITGFTLWLRSYFKKETIKNQAQIEIMQGLSEREDYKPQLNDQKNQLDNLMTNQNLLLEMYNLVFQNSDLSSETKEKLTYLANNIKYGEQFNKNIELQKEINELREQLATLKTKSVPVVEEQIRKVRR
ncbi:MAG: hypothetical protein RBR02_06390 [Desulfuromonadaceae bacterium]|nr:hypothetical protein [Desulfuromonadaceae bacterium]